MVRELYGETAKERLDFLLKVTERGSNYEILQIEAFKCVGTYREGDKYVAFDNSTHNCNVEEFDTEELAVSWMRGEFEIGKLENYIKKGCVKRFVSFILPEKAQIQYMEGVYESEDCNEDDIDTILSNAWWWHSGGETQKYHVDAMPVGDETDDIYCVIHNTAVPDGDDNEIGNLTLSLAEAQALNLWS